jgi:Mg/Co/Ni transporter MgtE
MLAREIMETHFQTLTPEHTISQAVHEFHRATQAQGKKIFGLMVTDDRDRLVGHAFHLRYFDLHAAQTCAYLG